VHLESLHDFAAMTLDRLDAQLQASSDLARPMSVSDHAQDFDLARSMHLRHTPTIFVLRADASLTDSMEVSDPAQLNQIVEEMLKKANLAIPSKHRAQE
jgi:hypothetical protein